MFTNLENPYKIEKFNIAIILQTRKATIVPLLLINTSHMIDTWYTVPFLFIFFEESYTSNAGTLKVQVS